MVLPRTCRCLQMPPQISFMAGCLITPKTVRDTGPAALSVDWLRVAFSFSTAHDAEPSFAEATGSLLRRKNIQQSRGPSLSAHPRKVKCNLQLRDPESTFEADWWQALLANLILVAGQMPVNSIPDVRPWPLKASGLLRRRWPPAKQRSSKDGEQGKQDAPVFC